MKIESSLLPKASASDSTASIVEPSIGTLVPLRTRAELQAQDETSTWSTSAYIPNVKGIVSHESSETTARGVQLCMQLIRARTVNIYVAEVPLKETGLVLRCGLLDLLAHPQQHLIYRDRLCMSDCFFG